MHAEATRACGTWDAQLKPALEALVDRLPPKQPQGTEKCFVLGVTWCVRNGYGNTSDASEAELYVLLSQHMSVRTVHRSSFESMRTLFFECRLLSE